MGWRCCQGDGRGLDRALRGARACRRPCTPTRGGRSTQSSARLGGYREADHVQEREELTAGLSVASDRAGERSIGDEADDLELGFLVGHAGIQRSWGSSFTSAGTGAVQVVVSVFPNVQTPRPPAATVW